MRQHFIIPGSNKAKQQLKMCWDRRNFHRCPSSAALRPKNHTPIFMRTSASRVFPIHQMVTGTGATTGTAVSVGTAAALVLRQPIRHFSIKGLFGLGEKPTETKTKEVNENGTSKGAVDAADAKGSKSAAEEVSAEEKTTATETGDPDGSTVEMTEEEALRTAFRWVQEGGKLFESGSVTEAKRKWTDAVELYEAGGVDDERVVPALNNLACACGVLGETDEKFQHLHRALKVLSGQHRDKPVYATALTNLAMAMGEVGNAPEMLRLLQEALAIQRKHFRPGHAKIAKTLISVAQAHGQLGEHVQQRNCLLEALPMVRARVGAKHEVVASTLAQLGIAIGKIGDSASDDSVGSDNSVRQDEKKGKGKETAATRSRKLIEEAAKMQEELLGATHPKVVATRMLLADACKAEEKQQQEQTDKK